MTSDPDSVAVDGRDTRQDTVEVSLEGLVRIQSHERVENGGQVR